MQPIRKSGYSGGFKGSCCHPSIERHYVTAAWKLWAGLNLHWGCSPQSALLAALIRPGCEHLVYVENGRWQTVFYRFVMAWVKQDFTLGQLPDQFSEWNSTYNVETDHEDETTSRTNTGKRNLARQLDPLDFNSEILIIHLANLHQKAFSFLKL